MRLVGEVSDTRLAKKFVEFLSVQNIEAEIRDSDLPNVGIWVLDEDRLGEAEGFFAKFLVNPMAAEFEVAAPQIKKNQVKPEGWPQPRRISKLSISSSQKPVTFAVIGICFLLALLSISPLFQSLRAYLFFSQEMGRDFPEIREGQIWRLVTPIFLHGNALHLFFNMLWMYQLGGEVETEEGSPFLLLFLLLTGTICDVAQYLMSGPAFVGLSGVVYGFLGYIWVMAKRSMTTRYEMNDQTLVIMLVWLAICILGIIPSVANTQHVVGLVFGLFWGWLRSQPKKSFNQR